MSGTELEKFLQDEAEHAEFTRGDPMPDGAKGERRNQEAARVYTVRLPAADVVRLEDLAEQRGIPAATLARGMIQRGLTEADGGLSAALDRASIELKRVQDMLGR